MVPDFDVSLFRLRCVSALNPIHLKKTLRRTRLTQTTANAPFKTEKFAQKLLWSRFECHLYTSHIQAIDPCQVDFFDRAYPKLIY